MKRSREMGKFITSVSVVFHGLWFDFSLTAFQICTEGDLLLSIIGLISNQLLGASNSGLDALLLLWSNVDGGDAVKS